jgi:hypothetical protein
MDIKDKLNDYEREIQIAQELCNWLRRSFYIDKLTEEEKSMLIKLQTMFKNRLTEARERYNWAYIDHNKDSISKNTSAILSKIELAKQGGYTSIKVPCIGIPSKEQAIIVEEIMSKGYHCSIKTDPGRMVNMHNDRFFMDGDTYIIVSWIQQENTMVLGKL